MREYGRYLDNRSIMGDVHKIISYYQAVKGVGLK